MRLTFLWLLILSISTALGQQLYFEMGPSVSNFDYTNSQGNSLDNLLSSKSVYLQAGYRHDLNNEKLHLNIFSSYTNYGAIGSDAVLNNFFEWDVTYLGIHAGVDYRLFRLREFSFFIKGSAGVEFLLRGNQTVNNQVFDLRGEDEFNSNIFMLKGGLMMTYPIARNTFLSAQYTYGNSALIGQNNTTDNEKLKIQLHQFGIGLIVNLPSCNCGL
ncbi:MAG: hypothetical protein ACWA5P_07410 [bacterium]